MTAQFLWLALAAMAQAPPKGDDLAWKRFGPEAGGFSVLLPARPTEQANTTPNVPGDVTVLNLKHGDAVFLAMRIPNPRPIPRAEQKAFFEGLKRHAAKGKLLAERRLQVDHAPALEVTTENSIDKDIMVQRARFVLKEDATYQLVVLAPRGKAPKDADRFLDSLQVTADGRPAPAAAAAAGASAAAGAGAAPARPDWQTFAPSGAGFSVLLPAAPQTKPEDEDDTILGHRPALQVFTPVGTGIIGVLYVDLNDDDLKQGYEKALARVRDDDAADADKHDGKLTRTRALTVAARPALEYEIEGSANGGMLMRLRSILVGKRLYQLAAIGPKADFPAAPAERLFKSFTLTAGAAAKPQAKARAGTPGAGPR